MRARARHVTARSWLALAAVVALSCESKTPNYCDQVTSTLCEDWEHRDVSRWTTSPRAFASEDVSAFDGRGSSQAIVTATQGGHVASAFRSTHVDVAGTTVRASTDVFIQKRASNELGILQVSYDPPRESGPRFLAIMYLTAENNIGIDEERSYGPGQAADASCALFHRAPFAYPTSTWFRMTMEMGRVAADGQPHATLWVDDNVVVDEPLYCWVGREAAPLTISSGLITQTGPSEPWQFRLDNLVLDSR